MQKSQLTAANAWTQDPPQPRLPTPHTSSFQLRNPVPLITRMRLCCGVRFSVVRTSLRRDGRDEPWLAGHGGRWGPIL